MSKDYILVYYKTNMGWMYGKNDNKELCDYCRQPLKKGIFKPRYCKNHTSVEDKIFEKAYAGTLSTKITKI